MKKSMSGMIFGIFRDEQEPPQYEKIHKYPQQMTFNNRGNE